MVGRFKGLKLRSAKAEICALRHVAVELESEKVVRVCVRPSVEIWYFPTPEFSETWSEVSGA